MPFLQAIVSSATGKKALEPRNILVAGIPGAGNTAPNLTDTILVVHIDPTMNRAVIFSLPRDLLVHPPDAEYYTKLNDLYRRGGITSLRLKAEDILGLEIDRYIVVDLAAVREIVDILGGVNVHVEKDIYDPRFPGSGSSYETFALEAGWRYLDGITATRYIRTRNDREGDFGRMRRQQLLLQALKQKVTGLSVVWDMTTFLKIFQSVNTHINTNFSTEELVDLFNWARSLSDDRITVSPLDADMDKHLFTTGSFPFGDEMASIVKPLLGLENYTDIQTYIQRVFDEVQNDQ